MTTVEQALAASPHHMTVLEISAASGLDPYTVRHELQDLAAADRIDHIPARGITPGRYALKSTPAGATPDDQPAVSNNTGCNGSDFHPFAEAVAVATQTPGPDAAIPPTAVEGSGGNVMCKVWLCSKCGTDIRERNELAERDYEIERIRAELAAERNLRLAYEDELRGDAISQAKDFSDAYIVLAAKRKPLRFTKLKNAREAAKSAIRAGAQRAEVFALVRVGVARSGAEWVES